MRKGPALDRSHIFDSSFDDGGYLLEGQSRDHPHRENVSLIRTQCLERSSDVFRDLVLCHGFDNCNIALESIKYTICQCRAGRTVRIVFLGQQSSIRQSEDQGSKLLFVSFELIDLASQFEEDIARTSSGSDTPRHRK